MHHIQQTMLHEAERLELLHRTHVGVLEMDMDEMQREVMKSKSALPPNYWVPLWQAQQKHVSAKRVLEALREPVILEDEG